MGRYFSQRAQTESGNQPPASLYPQPIPAQPSRLVPVSYNDLLATPFHNSTDIGGDIYKT
jgi:hypothetical protein